MLLVKVQRKAQHALRSTWVWKRDLASRTRPEEKVWHIIAQGIPTMQLGMCQRPMMVSCFQLIPLKKNYKIPVQEIVALNLLTRFSKPGQADKFMFANLVLNWLFKS